MTSRQVALAQQQSTRQAPQNNTQSASQKFELLRACATRLFVQQTKDLTSLDAQMEAILAEEMKHKSVDKTLSAGQKTLANLKARLEHEQTITAKTVDTSKELDRQSELIAGMCSKGKRVVELGTRVTSAADDALTSIDDTDRSKVALAADLCRRASAVTMKSELANINNTSLAAFINRLLEQSVDAAAETYQELQSKMEALLEDSKTTPSVRRRLRIGLPVVRQDAVMDSALPTFSIEPSVEELATAIAHIQERIGHVEVVLPDDWSLPTLSHDVEGLTATLASINMMRVAVDASTEKTNLERDSIVGTMQQLSASRRTLEQLQAEATSLHEGASKLTVDIEAEAEALKQDEKQLAEQRAANAAAERELQSLLAKSAALHASEGAILEGDIALANQEESLAELVNDCFVQEAEVDSRCILDEQAAQLDTITSDLHTVQKDTTSLNDIINVLNSILQEPLKASSTKSFQDARSAMKDMLSDATTTISERYDVHPVDTNEVATDIKGWEREADRVLDVKKSEATHTVGRIDRSIADSMARVQQHMDDDNAEEQC